MCQNNEIHQQNYLYESNILNRENYVVPIYYFRSSRSQMFFKIGVLQNYAIFKGKHLKKLQRMNHVVYQKSQKFLKQIEVFDLIGCSERRINSYEQNKLLS